MPDRLQTTASRRAGHTETFTRNFRQTHRGVQSDFAIRGITKQTFESAQAVNGECGGGPVIGLNGPFALGILDGFAAHPVDPAAPTRQVCGGGVIRLDAIMADASARLHSN